MKKIFTIILSTLMTVIMLSGCNKDMWDTNYTYNKAIIFMPNGSVLEGKVDNWTDYEDGDQLQVTIDGKVYLTHSSNIILIHE